MAEEGVRAARKRETRERIAAAAMELFAEHGFHAVPVSEVARAAGVTEKTVFNHFATKEDLVYSHDTRFETALVAAVHNRGDGSVLGAVRDFLLARYATMPTDPDAQARLRTLAALVARQRDAPCPRAGHPGPVRRPARRRHRRRSAPRPRRPPAADRRGRPGVRAPRRDRRVPPRRAVRPPAAEYGPQVVEAAEQAFALLAHGLDDFATGPRDP
ncbi:TetR/AcrR family transcriptional regulator [Actinomadura madurae]|uniref:TetR/AcrR family transcriptional regulator n=1 Tax=Actinomadura madurae TaxID=1993 RepID=UPI0020D2081D|nr:TetR/AcrR family transcriptional regulator [Actinomadura madurae]MCP9970163.1 TetR/AcrR family transcriptional regulator [Actinomadura madurae]